MHLRRAVVQRRFEPKCVHEWRKPRRTDWLSIYRCYYCERTIMSTDQYVRYPDGRVAHPSCHMNYVSMALKYQGERDESEV